MLLAAPDGVMEAGGGLERDACLPAAGDHERQLLHRGDRRATAANLDAPTDRRHRSDRGGNAVAPALVKHKLEVGHDAEGAELPIGVDEVRGARAVGRRAASPRPRRPPRRTRARRRRAHGERRSAAARPRATAKAARRVPRSDRSASRARHRVPPCPPPGPRRETSKRAGRARRGRSARQASRHHPIHGADPNGSSRTYPRHEREVRRGCHPLCSPALRRRPPRPSLRCSA